MTREPDRFDKQAREFKARFWRIESGWDKDMDEEDIAAALRAAESSALERAAQTFPDGPAYTWIRNKLRALIPPAAAPAAEGPLDKMKRALDEKVRMERERYASFCEAVAAGSPEDRAIAMAAPAAETGKVPAPDLLAAWAVMRMVDDAYWGEFCGCCGVILSLDAADEECGPQHTAVQLVRDWVEKHPEQPDPESRQSLIRKWMDERNAVIAAEGRVAELEDLLRGIEKTLAGQREREGASPGTVSDIVFKIVRKLAAIAAPAEGEGR